MSHYCRTKYTLPIYRSSQATGPARDCSFNVIYPGDATSETRRCNQGLLYFNPVDYDISYIRRHVSRLRPVTPLNPTWHDVEFR